MSKKKISKDVIGLAFYLGSILCGLEILSYETNDYERLSNRNKKLKRSHDKYENDRKGFSIAVKAITDSDMESYHKRCAIESLKYGYPLDTYYAVASIASSDMDSYHRRSLIEELFEED